MGPTDMSAPRSILVLIAETIGALLVGLLLAAVFRILGGLLFHGAGLGMVLLIVQLWAAVVSFGVGGGIGAAVAALLLGQRGTW